MVVAMKFKSKSSKRFIVLAFKTQKEMVRSRKEIGRSTGKLSPHYVQKRAWDLGLAKIFIPAILNCTKMWLVLTWQIDNKFFFPFQNHSYTYSKKIYKNKKFQINITNFQIS